MKNNKDKLFSVIAEKINNTFDSPFVVAIDGRSASGKTTFAKRFENLSGVAIIHTDDFYRPKNAFGELEISEFNGNFDLIRFKSEVIDNLKKKEFSYGIFDCAEQRIVKTVSVCAPKCILIEGAYSHNPNLSEYADLKIFFDIDEETQKDRICDRNGIEAYEAFKTLWIQAEERYIDHYKIKENSHHAVMEENNGNI